MMTSHDTYGAPADIETVVEASGLPPRLRERVYRTIDGREGVDADAAERIVDLVQAEYEEYRVDPLEPVGTVSAQSIGEPGTQMSLPPEEEVIVKQNEQFSVVSIGTLVDQQLDSTDSVHLGTHEVGVPVADISVISLRSDGSAAWKPVQEVSRHRSPEKLVRVSLASGRQITATDNHSFVIQTDTGDIVPVTAEELDVGERLPVIGTFSETDRGIDELTDLQGESSATSAGLIVQPRAESELLNSVAWEPIRTIERVPSEEQYVYDLSVEGLETFTTASGVVTHNTMNTFHYAGVAEIDVTQGLPRLIEIVDARKTPDTPTMKVYLEDEYATERERAHEVIWNIEATRILALGDVSTNVADMRVQIDLNDDTLEQRQITPTEIAEMIEDQLGVDAVQRGSFVEFGPEQPSYRRLLQLVDELRDIVFKGLEEVTRVVVRKEETGDGTEEFVLYTEGSAFGDVLDIEGVDATRTRTNNIHEILQHLGIEAAREAIIDEMLETLEEQALDDVNVRHLMLVADIMTARGEIESIGRHGIAGSKESVLARAAYEVTVNHLLDAAIHGEVDDLNGVIENVIVGKPIKLGTGDVNLRMSSIRPDGGQAD